MEAIPARINWRPNFNYKKCLRKTAMNTEETLWTNKSKLCMPEINNHAQLRHQKKPTIFSQKEWVLDKYSHTHTVFQGHSLPCPKGNRGQREKLPDHTQASRQSKEEKEIIKHEEFSTWTYQVLIVSWHSERNVPFSQFYTDQTLLLQVRYKQRVWQICKIQFVKTMDVLAMKFSPKPLLGLEVYSQSDNIRSPLLTCSMAQKCNKILEKN